MTIPKDVRKIIDVKEGDEVMFIVDNNRVVLTKTKDDIIQRTAGIWKNMEETGADFQKRIRKESCNTIDTRFRREKKSQNKRFNRRNKKPRCRI